MKKFFIDIFKPLGIVFGDIGTSPIYTLTIIALMTKPKQDDIYGIVSLIIWTIVIIVSIQYAYLAMRFSIRGEGGKIILGEIAIRNLKNLRMISFILLLIYLGIGFLSGDGIITPAISVLSAVEGIKVISYFQNLDQNIIIAITIVIFIFLFSIQKGGADKIYPLFSPIMLVWFLSLLIVGFIEILKVPNILIALNPLFAIEFIIKNGLLSFIILSEVILAATGGEALYSDMGHIGKERIQKSWFFFVFPSLTFNYLGQGAYLIRNPNSQSVFFEMFKENFPYLYIPFLILTISATIIASQAIITAVFSLFFQASNLGFFPRIRFKHLSKELYGQIYSSFINYTLFVLVVLIVIIFKKTENLGHAYGFSVALTMLITGILLSILHFHRKEWILFFLSIFITICDLLFVLSGTLKIPNGAYIPIVIAVFLIFIIINYTNGQRKVYEKLQPVDFKEFEVMFDNAYENANKIKGTAVFLVRDYQKVPPYVINVMFNQAIIYERNVFLSLVKKDEPFGIKFGFEKELLPGLDLFKIEFGYLEFVNVEEILKESGIDEKVIFYGIEEIVTNKWFYKIFAFIKKISPRFDEFYNFPSNKMHGVISRVII
ncbi:MAG: KUP/HAK/KT family potassium transporter [Candidatus Hydrothermia bacterium]|jgi:KUP system potassium uptake protein|nr:KUP/HAK/KT family potassium transporter [Candidatus Hydrothermia bacterium]